MDVGMIKRIAVINIFFLLDIFNIMALEEFNENHRILYDLFFEKTNKNINGDKNYDESESYDHLLKGTKSKFIKEHCKIFILIKENNIVGQATLQTIYRTFKIDHVLVYPSGKGYCTQLISKIVEKIVEKIKTNILYKIFDYKIIFEYVTCMNAVKCYYNALNINFDVKFEINSNKLQESSDLLQNKYKENKLIAYDDLNFIYKTEKLCVNIVGIYLNKKGGYRRKIMMY